MNDSEKSSLSISADRATGISSRAYGANIDAVGFNLDLIASKRPAKAVEILDLYSELKDITPDTLAQPGEDFGLAEDKLRKTLDDINN